MSGIIGGVGSKSGVVGDTEIRYTEGDWTPASTVGTLSNQSFTHWRRIGDQVWYSASVTFDGSGGGTVQRIVLPVGSATNSQQYNPSTVGYTTYTSGPILCIVWQNSNYVYFYKQSNATALDAAALANKRVDFTAHFVINTTSYP